MLRAFLLKKIVTESGAVGQNSKGSYMVPQCGPLGFVGYTGPFRGPYEGAM